VTAPLHRAIAVVIAVVGAAACGGDDATGPIPPELVGRWDAAPHCLPDCRFVLRSVPDPSDTLNITDRLSTFLVLEIRRSGAFDLNVTGGGISGFDESGTLTVGDGILILAGTTGTDTLEYVLDPPFLDVAFRERLAFDFDGDGTAEEATASARLLKVE